MLRLRSDNSCAIFFHFLCVLALVGVLFLVSKNCLCLSVIICPSTIYIQIKGLKVTFLVGMCGKYTTMGAMHKRGGGGFYFNIIIHPCDLPKPFKTLGLFCDSVNQWLATQTARRLDMKKITVVRVVEILELTEDHAIAKCNDNSTRKFEFNRPIQPESTVLHWNGLTLDEVNKVISYHNEKGFY